MSGYWRLLNEGDPITDDCEWLCKNSGGWVSCKSFWPSELAQWSKELVPFRRWVDGPVAKPAEPSAIEKLRELVRNLRDTANDDDDPSDWSDGYNEALLNTAGQIEAAIDENRRASK